MIHFFSIVIEILALVGLFYGYGKKGRNLMLLSGLLLLLGGPIHTHVRGFVLGHLPGTKGR